VRLPHQDLAACLQWFAFDNLDLRPQWLAAEDLFRSRISDSPVSNRPRTWAFSTAAERNLGGAGKGAGDTVCFPFLHDLLGILPRTAYERDGWVRR
jgi:hypothetical protein